MELCRLERIISEPTRGVSWSSSAAPAELTRLDGPELPGWRIWGHKSLLGKNACNIDQMIQFIN